MSAIAISEPLLSSLYAHAREVFPAECCGYLVGPADEVTTIEGLPATVGRDLHPMQEAWLEYDVAQCGYCQPGQIMTAVAKVRRAREEGREIDEADLDEIRNICRCGTYNRIREAITAGAEKF